MEQAIQALIMLSILAASAVVFTVIFVIVADRELAKPEPENGQSNEEREESNGRIEREAGEGSEGEREESEDTGGERGR